VRNHHCWWGSISDAKVREMPQASLRSFNAGIGIAADCHVSQTTSADARPVMLFLCGDVMTGRGVDQILPFPSNPVSYEPYVDSALEYMTMAERINGPIPKPAKYPYIWGDALEELTRLAPAARIINLETSVTTSDERDPKGINYRMHPANTPCLTAAKIDCCVLANNHVMDWGRAGLTDTLGTLRRAGIKTAGAGRNLAEAWEPAAIEVRNSNVLVFAVGTPDSGIGKGWAATNSAPGVALLPDLSDAAVKCVADHVAKVKRPGDIAILSIHWGENWGYQIPRRETLFARKLVDVAGVDMVHGHSSHHPKGIEIYRNKPILYGCGDFLNDYEGIAGYENFRSHLVSAYFPTLDASTGNLLHLAIVPFVTKRFQLRRATPEDVAWLADLLTREGKPLGTRVNLDGPNRLSLAWTE
jgi:poly-gamma-glutamate synthesis protein (capsule biosynthesis protein)